VVHCWFPLQQGSTVCIKQSLRLVCFVVTVFTGRVFYLLKKSIAGILVEWN
jgi:hypothetical protein